MLLDTIVMNYDFPLCAQKAPFFCSTFEWDLKLIYFPLCSTRRQLSLCLGCWDVRDMGSAPNAEEEALPLNLLQQYGSKVFLKLNFYFITI